MICLSVYFFVYRWYVCSFFSFLFFQKFVYCCSCSCCYILELFSHLYTGIRKNFTYREKRKHYQHMKKKKYLEDAQKMNWSFVFICIFFQDIWISGKERKEEKKYCIVIVLFLFRYIIMVPFFSLYSAFAKKHHSVSFILYSYDEWNEGRTGSFSFCLTNFKRQEIDQNLVNLF
jgi:hypothetical protein